MNVEIQKKYGTVIVPADVMEDIRGKGMYITCTKIKRSYGIYHQVMVCKKDGGRLAFRSALARYILNAPPAKHVDHIDRNPLNNSRDNLRLVNPSENGANRRKGRGTTFSHKGIARKGQGRFYATIKKDGIRYSAGTFNTETEAAKAYDKLAKWLFGKFAALNFPEEQ